MNKIKKIVNNKYFIIGLITLFIIAIGITGTYAWLTWSSPNTTEMTITIGNIADVIFDNGQDIYTTNLSPVFYPEEGERNNFSIVKRSTAASANITYTVTLDITTIAEELKNTSFKYVLLNTTGIRQVIKVGDFSTSSNGDTITLYSSALTNKRVDFEFIIYIDSNNENNTNMMNKEFKATINVSASEKSYVTMSQYITNLYRNVEKETVTNNSIEYNYANIYDTDDDSTTSGGLINDRLGGTTIDYEVGNIRYYGSNPSNYIYFNCDDYSNQTSKTCELWRIIGVFDGKVKIIKNESIGTYSWDNKDTTTGAETNFGKNDWTTARLMKLLNPSDYYTIDSNDNGYGQSLYYNSESGICYSGQNNATTSCDFTSTGIKNNTTRNMIAEATWNLGGIKTTLLYPDEIYDYERGEIVYEGRPTTWIGKIALAYPSDYGYAADLGRCTQTLDNYSNSICTSVNWLFYDKSLWLLSASTSYSEHSAYLNKQGYLSGSYNYGDHVVLPTLYLNSNIGIGLGEGTSTNPYQLQQ